MVPWPILNNLTTKPNIFQTATSLDTKDPPNIPHIITQTPLKHILSHTIPNHHHHPQQSSDRRNTQTMRQTKWEVSLLSRLGQIQFRISHIGPMENIYAPKLLKIFPLGPPGEARANGPPKLLLSVYGRGGGSLYQAMALNLWPWSKYTCLSYPATLW